MSELAIRESHEICGLVNDVIVELAKQEQAECPVRHYFGQGIAIREVEFPAGKMAVGHIQKYQHWNLFLKGKVRMLCNDGSYQDISAPMMFMGEAGRKVGLILEDVVWQNIYATDITDPEELENYFMDKSSPLGDFSDYRLSGQSLDDDGDYLNAIAELGYTQEMVEAEYLRTDDLIAFPFGEPCVQVSNSVIHGKGLFATAPMNAGYMIPARLSGKRTPAGRYTNHSKTPNAKFIEVSGDIYLQLLSDVGGCKGGLLGNEITIDYRDAVRVSRGIK